MITRLHNLIRSKNRFVTTTKNRFVSIFFNKNNIRKIYFRRIILKHFNVEKLKFYRQLQKSFNQISFLIHFFVNRILFINIDVFKQRDFEIMIYHLNFSIDSTKSKRIDVKSILFLNRMLNETKKRY